MKIMIYITAIMTENECCCWFGPYCDIDLNKTKLQQQSISASSTKLTQRHASIHKA